MESKEKYFKPKALSIAQQLVKIQYDYSNFMCETESNSTLIILGEIKPTPLSCYYKVRIEYKIGNRPNIFIVSPQLRFNNIKIPHTYKDNELCLFYPKYKEWTKYDYISDKIIVMKDGKIVEQGSRDDILNYPKHDYTKSLLEAVPGWEDELYA